MMTCPACHVRTSDLMTSLLSLIEATNRFEKVEDEIREWVDAQDGEPLPNVLGDAMITAIQLTEEAMCGVPSIRIFPASGETITFTLEHGANRSSTRVVIAAVRKVMRGKQ